MPSSIKFEEANEKDLKWMIDQLRLKHFRIEVISGKRIIFSKGKWTEIFAVSPKVYELYKKIKRQPYSLGLHIGEGRRELKPALPIAEYCENEMQIRMTQENHITYGKDPVPEAKTLLEGDFMVFVNSKKEPLGYGKVKNGKVKNIKDIGWYIREGK